MTKLEYALIVALIAAVGYFFVPGIVAGINETLGSIGEILSGGASCQAVSEVGAGGCAPVG